MNAVDLDNDYDDFVGEDEWEDEEEVEQVLERYPGWYLVKVTNYTHAKMEAIKEWCEANCTTKWEKVGWYSGCAYTVGVILEGHVDAVLFRLTWGD